MWERFPMSFKPSPYAAGWLMSWALEWAKGDPNDVNNSFSFEFICLNLPGSPNFNPHLGLWVIKLDSQDQPSGDAILYVDDGWVLVQMKCTLYPAYVMCAASFSIMESKM
jgi:hypothetical protein